jgi:hypothetical protein
MDLKWLSPKNAKDFINYALNKNLLIKKDDLCKPNFNVDNIQIPIGFHPSNNVLFTINQSKEDNLSISSRIIKIICDYTNNNEKEIIDKIRDIARDKNIFFEIALLLYAKEFEIELKEFYDHIIDYIF